VVLPAYPKPENLLPFFVSATTTFDFYIDAKSISSGEDGVVRYVLVARSAQGAETVSYEGIRCSEKAFRIYATGAGGQWTSRPTGWRPIEPRSIQRWHNALWREYFCPIGVPIRNAEEGVEALLRGDHPSRPSTGG